MPTELPTPIKKAQPVKSNIFNDNRGTLHSLKSMAFHTKEVLVSHSYVGTLRGLHWSPYQKQIYICKGKILDFWFVPATGECFEGILSAGDGLVVPAKAMHGFYALEEVDMLYFLEGRFDPQVDCGYHWESPGLPFKYEFPRQNLIISAKDDGLPFYTSSDYLLLGASGYLGAFTARMLKQQGRSVLSTSVRLDDTDALKRLITKSQCKYVICAAGISGRPTTAWCEDHEKETYQVNYVQMLNLMELTESLGVHLTIYGTGLLYALKPDKQVFTEEDQPDLNNSVYVRYRVELESHLRLYHHVLCLRILYPITADGHEKCFLTKMKTRASSVHNVSVAVTVVPDLFPMLPKLIESHTVGPLNFVNTGVISLPDLLNIYGVECKVTDPTPKPGVELSTVKLTQVSERTVHTVQDALRSLVKI